MATKRNHDSFESIGKFRTSTLKARGLLRFGFLYNQHDIWKKILIVLAVGCMMGFANLFFVKNTGLYTSGVGGISQGLARIVQTKLSLDNTKDSTITLVFNLMFWLGVAAMNLPLFIFGWIKISRQFALLTGFYIISSSLIGFGLSYIPHINSVYLLGPAHPEGCINQGGNPVPNFFMYHNIDNLPFYFDHFGSENSLNNLLINYWYKFNVHNPSGTPNYYDLKDLIYNQNYDPYKSLFLILYSCVYGVIIAACYAMLYIVGSSTGGSDFITIYFSSKKSRPLGGIMVVVNTSLLLMGFILGNYVSGGLVCPAYGWRFEFFFSANLVSSFIAILINGLLLNSMFPINKFAKIEIISAKINSIKKKLIANKFNHAISIAKNIGAKTNKDVDVMWTVCTYIEIPKLIDYIRKVDNKAMVIVENVTAVDGQLKILKPGASD